MTTAELQAQPSVDVQQMIVNKLNESLTSDKFEKMVDEAVTKCLYNCVSNIFTSYGEFSKSLESKLKERLAIHCNLDEIPQYNDLVIKIITRNFETKINEILGKQISETMEALLETAPKEIYLDKLREEFVRWIAEDDGVDFDYVDEFGEYLFRVEESGSADGYFHVVMDKDPKAKKWAEAFRLSVTREGAVYAMRVGQVDMEKTLFIGPVFGFEKLLFGMKAAGTRIIR